MYRILPFLFLLSSIPDSDKKLETINNLLTVTKESVKNIKNGMETFHATMAPFLTRPGERKDR